MNELAGICKARTYSQDLIEKIRLRLRSEMDLSSLCIITVGSFARREASEQSDIDFFIITDGSVDGKKELEQFRKMIQEYGIRMPATSGAFNEIASLKDMICNIGGPNDDNDSLTRRLLILLEGEWLYNEKLFNTLFDDLLLAYVKDTITQHQLCRFLLNDLIRYYRTIGVDFENKTTEGGKPWGDRNIKLMYSRKLLYFSGILVVAETVQHTALEKREILKKYLRKTPLDRVLYICGHRAEKALAMYDEFTYEMALPKTRDMLKVTTSDRQLHTNEFRNLKNKGHHFSLELSRLLSETFDSSHPIHMAIKF